MESSTLLYTEISTVSFELLTQNDDEGSNISANSSSGLQCKHPQKYSLLK